MTLERGLGNYGGRISGSDAIKRPSPKQYLESERKTPRDRNKLINAILPFKRVLKVPPGSNKNTALKVCSICIKTFEPYCFLIGGIELTPVFLLKNAAYQKPPINYFCFTPTNNYRKMRPFLKDLQNLEIHQFFKVALLNYSGTTHYSYTTLI